MVVDRIGKSQFKNNSNKINFVNSICSVKCVFLFLFTILLRQDFIFTLSNLLINYKITINLLVSNPRDFPYLYPPQSLGFSL